jgi:predicted nucleic acid-binding protein
MILLDSTFLIDLLRDKEGILEKARSLDNERLVTTEINIFEVMIGVHSSKKLDMTKDRAKAQELFSTLIVLPLDREGSLKAAEIAGKLNKTGQRIGELDCLTAGIALVHGVSQIITENKAHFNRISGIKMLSY